MNKTTHSQVSTSITFRDMGVKENFPRFFGPLQRLSLSIESDSGLWGDWSAESKTGKACRNLMGILRSATKLESIELRLSSQVRSQFFYVNLEFPSLPNLLELILRNVHITKRYLENLLLPWCFSNGVETLHLASCNIVGVCVTHQEQNRMALFKWLFDQEVEHQEDTTTEDNERKLEKLMIIIA